MSANASLPFVLDCDTGRDDALTIWAALNLGLPLSGLVASYGNTVLKNVVRNCTDVLSVASHADIPVWVGAPKPTSVHAGFKNVVLPRQAVAGNGLCNISLRPNSTFVETTPLPVAMLAQHIQDLVSKVGKIDYVITGPATNFALMLDHWEEPKDLIASVTMMGGKFDAMWARVPGADFNLVCDPYAVDRMIQSGLLLRFVPMDATWPIALRLDEIEALDATDPVAQIAKDLMIAHCRHFAPEPIFRFHDPSVIIAMLKPTAFQEKHVSILCNDTSADFGRLIETPDGTPVQVYAPTDALRDEIRADILAALHLIQ